MAPIISDNIISRLHSTELEILQLLMTGGRKTTSDIQKEIRKTREHTARLMKKMFDQGLIDRDENKRPYTYTIGEKIRKTIRKSVKQHSLSEKQDSESSQ